MTEELQSRIWQCLPKDAREEAKRLWELDTLPAHPDYDPDSVAEGAAYILTELFGHHNLTSDDEPSELLFVERKTITNMYEANERIINKFDDEKMKDHSVVINGMLESIFGDKCLPDKEPSVQCESKFKFKYDIDDKVLLKGSDKPMLIRQRVGFQDYDNGYQITTLDTRYPQWVKESELAPYTEPEQLSVQGEPKFKVGDKVKIWINSYGKVYDGIIKTIKSVRLYNDNVFVYSFFDYDLELDEHRLELYTEPETKDNMEEEELDIYELLESCSDVEQIYSVIHDAEVDFKLSNRYIEFMGLSYYSNGSMYDVAGRCMLYPSRALYEKYPLDAMKAWMEWKSERTPKRWRAKHGETYWYLDRRFISKECTTGANSDFDRTNYENGNMFRTEELAQQATEAVRECLMKFHEEHKQQ